MEKKETTKDFNLIIYFQARETGGIEKQETFVVVGKQKQSTGSGVKNWQKYTQFLHESRCFLFFFFVF